MVDWSSCLLSASRSYPAELVAVRARCGYVADQQVTVNASLQEARLSLAKQSFHVGPPLWRVGLPFLLPFCSLRKTISLRNLDPPAFVMIWFLRSLLSLLKGKKKPWNSHVCVANCENGQPFEFKLHLIMFCSPFHRSQNREMAIATIHIITPSELHLKEEESSSSLPNGFILPNQPFSSSPEPLAELSHWPASQPLSPVVL